jgi:hypothetical protein
MFLSGRKVFRLHFGTSILYRRHTIKRLELFRKIKAVLVTGQRGDLFDGEPFVHQQFAGLQQPQANKKIYRRKTSSVSKQDEKPGLREAGQGTDVGNSQRFIMVIKHVNDCRFHPLVRLVRHLGKVYLAAIAASHGILI